MNAFTHVVRLMAGAIITVSVVASPTVSAARPMTDAAIKQVMIRESIASYPGNCPCPYNAARNGSSCGGRSAYSRPGGYAPLCYASDISKSDVEAYRRANSH